MVVKGLTKVSIRYILELKIRKFERGEKGNGPSE